jgi:uncharacterized CHY-type Zn-finger protein
MSIEKTAVVCGRCGSQLDSQGYCKDLTCPFNDHLQSCNAGWNGHSERDPNPNDDTKQIPCTCS